MRNVDDTTACMKRFRAAGVTLSIDDFGTGYSSLGYLRQFPVDALKIDRSFVQDLHTSDDDAAICAAIIAMARELKLKVIAEGVENAGAARVPARAPLRPGAGLPDQPAGRRSREFDAVAQALRPGLMRLARGGRLPAVHAAPAACSLRWCSRHAATLARQSRLLGRRCCAQRQASGARPSRGAWRTVHPAPLQAAGSMPQRLKILAQPRRRRIADAATADAGDASVRCPPGFAHATAAEQCRRMPKVRRRRPSPGGRSTRLRAPVQVPGHCAASPIGSLHVDATLRAARGALARAPAGPCWRSSSSGRAAGATDARRCCCCARL